MFAPARALAWSQVGQLKTTEGVLEKYKQALGGGDAIKKVQSETRRGEVEGTGINGKVTFVSYAKPFQWLHRVSLPDGREVTSGFDGSASWSVDPQGASIDTGGPVEAVRRDAHL